MRLAKAATSSDASARLRSAGAALLPAERARLETVGVEPKLDACTQCGGARFDSLFCTTCGVLN